MFPINGANSKVNEYSLTPMPAGAPGTIYPSTKEIAKPEAHKTYDKSLLGITKLINTFVVRPPISDIIRKSENTSRRVVMFCSKKFNLILVLLIKKSTNINIDTPTTNKSINVYKVRMVNM